MKKKLIRITTVSGSIRVLLKGQLEYVNKSYEVIAMSASDPPGSLEKTAAIQGVRAIPLDMTRKITPFKDLIAIIKLYRILKREKPFFVHTHTPKAGLVGMSAAYLARVPRRMHDVAGLPLLVATGYRRQLLELVEKITNALATHVYPNSHNLSIILAELGLCKKRKLKVLGNGSSNGVDIEHFDRNALPDSEVDELKKQLGIAKNDVVFLFIGRLVGDKGINELVEAFSKIAEKQKNVKLLLVGAHEKDLDPLKATTNEQIERHPQIIYVGNQNDVRPYYAVSDILSFPTYREGFPNVPMEAGAMGLPSIVTDINGCNEIISDRINGLIIPPQQMQPLLEAMELLLEDTELRATLAENARPLVKEKYERKEVWDRILEEYRHLEEVSS
jgi:glycosyltransferase involved in cell wall biosynthesis